MTYEQNADLEGAVVLEDLPLGDAHGTAVVNAKPKSANLPAVVTAVVAKPVQDEEDLDRLLADLDLDQTPVHIPASPVIASGRFNYSAIAPAVAKEAQATVLRIHNRHATSNLETGADLLKMKKLLGHGYFTDWLEAEFEMAVRTAHNWMNAAELVAKDATVAVLPQGALYKLAAKNVPEAAVKAVTVMINARKTPTLEEVVDMIKQAKDAERETKAAERTTKSPTTAPSKEQSLEKVQKQKQADKRAREKEAARAEEQKQAGSDALDMLRKTLGDSLSEFRSLYLKSNGQFDVLIRKP